MGAIILMSVIIVLVVALLLVRDDAQPPQSSPNVSKRREEGKTLTYKGTKPIGALQNGDIYLDNGELYVVNDGKTVKISQESFINDVAEVVMDKMWMPTPTYFHGCITTPTTLSQNKFVAIGDVFDIEKIFCDDVKDKARKLFDKRHDRIIYGQRCDVYPNGCVSAKNFTHIGGKNITDPMGKPIEKILLINDRGELVKKTPIPITYKESEKYDDLLYNTIGVNPIDKVYVVWTNGYRRKGGYCERL